ncbi:hypothetical protein JCM8202_004662 [Rhodotorula sphaerocarpa]
MTSALPCPFTAGGCPLFNIVGTGGGGTTARTPCAGGCSPPATAPIATATRSAKQVQPARAPTAGAAASAANGAKWQNRRQSSVIPSPIAYDSYAGLNATPAIANPSPPSMGLTTGLTDALLFGELSLPLPENDASAALSLGAQSTALDAAAYGVSPGQVEMSSLLPPQNGAGPRATAGGAPSKAPFATGSSSTLSSGQAYASGSQATLVAPAKHELWDIEELCGIEKPNVKRTRRSPSPRRPLAVQTDFAGASVPTEVSGENVQLPTPPLLSGFPVLPSPPTPPSPTSPVASPEDAEHITPFISKLCFLLEHPEYEPWVRWDSTGQYLLVAHSKPHLLHILEKFFRHTVIASFIRQLNIYGFRRASTSVLLSVLESTKYATSVSVPGRDEPETFSAADYSAFHNPSFFRSTPGGAQCRLAALKPIAKEHGARRGKSGGKARRRGQTAALLGLAGVGLYTYDREYNASALRRSLRTAVFGITLALDFKLNFDPLDADKIDRIHERTAQRLSRLVEQNVGMYVKLAQALAIQAAILPKPYREAFANVFDGAPAVPWDEVVRVFQGEFGIHPDTAFETFEHEPLASASIAQVHKARLKAEPGKPWRDGEGWVAVKVRKEAVPKQMEWDLFCYRVLLWSYEKIFDLPVAFVSQYVSEQMRKEGNLRHEADNAMRTAEYLAKEPTLRDRVRVPKIYDEWTGESVMTAEFVQACRLTDTKRLKEMKMSVKEAMDTATELFSAMVFKWGFVQADPHPGNLLCAPNPKNPAHPEVILIDHGLYVELPETFRHEYCLLWQSLFTGNVAEIENIAVNWGIRRQNSDIFASLTLLRPHRLHKKQEEEEAAKNGEGAKSEEQLRLEQRAGLKERLKTMLESEELIPRELIFVTRAMRMMQGNNQSVGSVSNRINILAHWAAVGLAVSSPQQSFKELGLKKFATEKLRIVVFKVVLVFIDLGFMFTRIRSWWLEKLGKKGAGLEDLLQQQVTDMAKREFGVEIGDEAFAG